VTATSEYRATVEQELGTPLVLRGDLFPVGGFVMPMDKPRGISSFGVVRAVRRHAGKRKVGHAGTLDPMATGLLVVLVGPATKQSSKVMGWPKRYTGVIRLGEETASYDAETPVETSSDISGVTDEMIREASQQFVGTIRQITPAYSAVRVGGERSYRIARRGETAIQPPRIVTVTRFDVHDRFGPDVRFSLDCSTGTYVRSIAHDLGQALGVGGHLVELRREAIGSLLVEDAITLQELDRVPNGEA
jgi:tRNA pseudouridine55 synthase